MKFLSILFGSLIAVSFNAFSQNESGGDTNYPERPISLIVPWAAGGGTDAVGRMIASELQERLGVPVNVVNRTGAGGIVGHTAMSDADPDGYTLGLATAEITTYNAIGSSSMTYADLTPVALMNFDASAFNVAEDSEWQTASDALQAISDNPGEYKASGFPVGAAYHLAFASFLDANGVDPNAVTVVPSQGAAPGFQELVSGGVAIVPSSLPEAASMRDAKRVKTLAVLAEERLAAYPDVMTAEEATGVKSVGGTWRGIVGPKDLPEEIVGKLETVLEEIYQDSKFQDFMSGRGFGVQWLDAEGFEAFMAEMSNKNAEVIEKLNLSQN